MNDMPNIDVTPIEQPHDGMNLFQQVSLARSICKEEKQKTKNGQTRGEKQMSLWSYRANGNDSYFCLMPHFPL